MVHAAHEIVVDVSFMHVYINECMASNSQYALPPQSFPQESITEAVSPSYSKQSSKGSSPENFMAIGGCFKYAIATRITLQHYRPVEEERKKIKNNFDF